MAATYKIDGELLIENPLQKRWTRQMIGNGALGKPLNSQYWSLDFTFSVMRAGSGTPSSQLVEKWLDNGLHSATLPHPLTGDLAVFSGVAIESVSFSFTDVDSDKWADNVNVKLSHISLLSSWSV